MTNHGYHKGPVIAILAIYDSGQHAYGTGISTFEANVEASVDAALNMALVHADRKGEVPNLILYTQPLGMKKPSLNVLMKGLGR